MGDLAGAQEVIERAFEGFEASSEQDRLAARAAGQDAGVADLALMSWALWLLGRADTALTRLNTAIRRADDIGHPHSQAYGCYYASILHALRGELPTAHRYAERCLALSEEHGFRQWRGLARAIRGISATATFLDPSSAAFAEIRTAMDEYRSAGYQLGITALFVLLCPTVLFSHNCDAVLDLIEQGLVTVNQSNERVFEAELYRLKARVLLVRGAPDAAMEAQSLLEKALATARRQDAKALELRAAKDLAELWNDQGKREDALTLLQPIHDWFTEGFGTQDLRDAKALLDQLR
jgi:predicted ATPase